MAASCPVHAPLLAVLVIAVAFLSGCSAAASTNDPPPPAVPITYNLDPDMQATANSPTQETLTLTLTNNYSVDATFVVPCTVTDTQGMAVGMNLSFDFRTTPLAPGASRSQTVVVNLPPSGNDTFTFTVDGQGSLGTNLAGSPATASLPFGSG